jgi:hypothetical protein
MNFKPFMDAIPYIGVGLLFFTTFYGALDISVTVSSHVESWLRAKRNVNVELPALEASVKELRAQQSRFELELARIRNRTAD